MGNCAHCHNPRGEPSVDNPVLVDVLNFLPGPTGGYFQFPLDQMSPRISRGPGGLFPIPYITPSLIGFPVEGDTGYRFWFPKADADGLWPLTPDVPKSTNTRSAWNSKGSRVCSLAKPCLPQRGLAVCLFG